MTPDELVWLQSEFNRCSEWIQAAIDRTLGEYELSHVWDRIRNGSAQIWPLPNGVVITTIETYPSGLRILFMWLAGGKLKDIQACETVLTDWAKSAGCRYFMTDGRDGWSRVFGGRKLSSKFVKDIR